MVEMSLKVDIARAVTTFKKRGKNIVAAISDAIRETAFILEAAGKKAITSGPTRAIDTGRLRASIGGGKFRGGFFPERYGITIERSSAKITADTKYAKFVHEGTRYMRARPFFKRAIKLAEADINRAFNFHIKRALR